MSNPRGWEEITGENLYHLRGYKQMKDRTYIMLGFVRGKKDLELHPKPTGTYRAEMLTWAYYNSPITSRPAKTTERPSKVVI